MIKRAYCSNQQKRNFRSFQMSIVRVVLATYSKKLEAYIQSTKDRIHNIHIHVGTNHWYNSCSEHHFFHCCLRKLSQPDIETGTVLASKMRKNASMQRGPQQGIDIQGMNYSTCPPHTPEYCIPRLLAVKTASDRHLLTHLVTKLSRKRVRTFHLGYS